MLRDFGAEEIEFESSPSTPEYLLIFEKIKFESQFSTKHVGNSILESNTRPEKLRSARKDITSYRLFIHVESGVTQIQLYLQAFFVFFESGNVTLRFHDLFLHAESLLMSRAQRQRRSSRKISGQNRFHRFNRNFSRSLILLRIPSTLLRRYYFPWVFESQSLRRTCHRNWQPIYIFPQRV